MVPDGPEVQPPPAASCEFAHLCPDPDATVARRFPDLYHTEMQHHPGAGIAVTGFFVAAAPQFRRSPVSEFQLIGDFQL
jgi:hypothetical protein